MRIEFRGAIVKCTSCGSELFEELIDDHCQVFRCLRCARLVVFGNAAALKRLEEDEEDVGSP